VPVCHHPGITRALQDADVFINRCGQTRSRQACSRACTSPEPLYNLDALQRHGAAVSLPGVPTADALTKALRTLDEGSGADNARKLGDQLRAGAGACSVVMELEGRRSAHFGGRILDTAPARR